jgi:hypothetical protein
MSIRTAGVSVVFAAAMVCAPAQWLDHAAPGTPRTLDGKADLSAKAPRTSAGKPDLSGVWRTALTPPAENERIFGGKVSDFVVPGDDPRTFSKYFLDILSDFKPEESPMLPGAAEILATNIENRGTLSPAARCLPQGLPRADIFSYAPFKIIQTSTELAFLYEVDDTYRQIYIDGRKFPVDLQPAWLGYSVGKWEGDVLVVDAAGFNDKTWLDSMGHPHSERLRVHERFHRRDFGHMDLTVTVTDPVYYSKPITFQVTEVLIPDSDVLENICNENEKDQAHLK